MKMLSLVVILGASATLAAQDPASQKPTPTPVAIQGCVDRAVPNSPAMYILIDAQAGGASPVIPSGGRAQTTPPQPPLPKAPDVVEPRYWLAGPVTIDFAKFQNQRVEVIGVVTEPPAPAAGVKPPAPDAPKSLVQVQSLKMLSTECKGLS